MLDLSDRIERGQMKPFVKWLGGKRKLAPTIISHFPTTYNTYREPFLGGGAILLAASPPCARVSDINEDLIRVYDYIKNGDLDYLETLLSMLVTSHTEEQYYEIRAWDRESEWASEDDVIKVAWFLYLNKAGFNGVCRYNSKGYFNVPSGHKEVLDFDFNNMKELSEQWNRTDVVFSTVSFETSIASATSGDVIYLDPPYDDTFSTYHTAGFNRTDQETLYALARDSVERGARVVASNNHTDFIIDLWLQDGLFEPYDPLVNRSIGAGYGADKKVREILLVGG